MTTKLKTFPIVVLDFSIVVYLRFLKSIVVVIDRSVCLSVVDSCVLESIFTLFPIDGVTLSFFGETIPGQILVKSLSDQVQSVF